jgi:hypothetical protein
VPDAVGTVIAARSDHDGAGVSDRQGEIREETDLAG